MKTPSVRDTGLGVEERVNKLCGVAETLVDEIVNRHSSHGPSMGYAESQEACTKIKLAVFRASSTRPPRGASFLAVGWTNRRPSSSLLFHHRSSIDDRPRSVNFNAWSIAGWSKKTPWNGGPSELIETKTIAACFWCLAKVMRNSVTRGSPRKTSLNLLA